MFDSKVFFNGMLNDLRMSKNASLYDVVIPNKYKSSACIGLDLVAMFEYQNNGIGFDIIDKERQIIYKVSIEKNQLGDVSNYIIVEINENEGYINSYSCKCDDYESARSFRLTSVTKSGIYTIRLVDEYPGVNNGLLVLSEEFYNPGTSTVIGNAFLEPDLMDKSIDFGIYSDIDFKSIGIQIDGLSNAYIHFKQTSESVMSFDPSVERVLN